MDYTKFSPEQYSAISPNAENLLVSAAAGSGKTTVMIARIVKMLSQEEASLDNMLICTFTRASAADMREKLHRQLLKEREEGAKWADKQLKLLQQADICTIDAWCQKLLRTYFYAVGIDPAFDILDESNRQALLGQSVEEVLQERRQSGSERFFAIDEALRKHRSDEEIRSLVTAIYEFSQTQTNASEFLEQAANLYDGGYKEVAKPFFATKRKACAKRLLRVLEGAQQCGCPGKTVDVWHAAYRAALEDDCTLVKNASYTKMNEFLAQEAGDAMTELRDLFELESDVLNGGAIDDTIARELIGMAQDVTERYRALKARRGELDYADAEYLAEKLLSDPAILQDVRAHTKLVFVDEYQDINPLQNHLLQLLKDPQEGNMFLVGDLKQSIYAFRNCDPTIFASLRDHYQDHGFAPPIEFTGNFRCEEQEIVNFINDVFCEHMTEEFGSVDYRRHQLRKCKPSQEEERRERSVRSFVYLPDKSRKDLIWDYDILSSCEEKKNDEILAEAVAVDLIERIAQAKAAGEVNFSDFAVLTRSRTSLAAKVYDSLKSAGIPVGIVGELYYSSKPSISFLLELLRYLDNHEDDIAFVAACYDPIFALTLDELLKISSSCPSSSFARSAKRYCASNQDATARKLQHVFDFFDYFDQRVCFLTVGELLGEMVARLDYFTVVLRRYGADDSQLLSDFLDMVNDCVVGDSIGRFLSYVEDKGNEAAQDTESDRVQMMTIHASKGLEFKHVYLIGTEKKGVERDRKCLMHRDLGVVVKTMDDQERTWTENPFFTLAREIRRKQEDEEELRLLYVALTRAIRSLTVYAQASITKTANFYDGFPKRGNTFFAWMSKAIQDYGYTVLTPEDCVIKSNSVLMPLIYERKWHTKTFGKGDDKIVQAMEERFARLDDIVAHARQAGALKTTVTAQARLAAQSDEESWDTVGSLSAVFPIDKDRDATEIGNDYHKVMEQFDFVDFVAESEKMEQSGMEQWQRVDKRSIRAAFEAVASLCQGAKLYKEKSFVANVDGTLLQGVIDLLIVREGKATVVDYKTTKVSNLNREQTLREYVAQTGLYAAAVRDILGMEVEKVCLYSFEAGSFIDLPMTTDDGDLSVLLG